MGANFYVYIILYIGFLCQYFNKDFVKNKRNFLRDGNGFCGFFRAVFGPKNLQIFFFAKVLDKPIQCEYNNED